MPRYFSRTRIPMMGALVAVVVLFGPAAFAQNETPAAAGSAAIGANDSLALASNDSTALADGIKALIKQEESGFWNRLKRSGIGVLYVKGGIFMHPLLLCSIIGLVFIIERLWTLSRAKTDVPRCFIRG
ncbi:MAG: hypothetical protein HY770_05110 [Chitinivibrionia bacterium]|nr:hypothetical protein [Chitinivibrionia bacterium]